MCEQFGPAVLAYGSQLSENENFYLENLQSVFYMLHKHIFGLRHSFTVQLQKPQRCQCVYIQFFVCTVYLLLEIILFSLSCKKSHRLTSVVKQINISLRFYVSSIIILKKVFFGLNLIYSVDLRIQCEVIRLMLRSTCSLFIQNRRNSAFILFKDYKN